VADDFLAYLEEREESDPHIIGNPLFLWRVLKQRFRLLRFENKNLIPDSN
jgi:hypothetical protein